MKPARGAGRRHLGRGEHVNPDGTRQATKSNQATTMNSDEVITVNFGSMRKKRVRLAASAAVVALAGAGAVLAGAVPSLAGSVRQVPSPVIPLATAIAVPLGVPTNVPPTATPPTWTIEVADNNFGATLITPGGMSLYRQSAACTNCSSISSQYTPYLLAAGQTPLKPPMLNGTVGMVTLPDGSHQVTYDGCKLYLFSGDHVRGGTNGVGLYWMVAKQLP